MPFSASAVWVNGRPGMRGEIGGSLAGAVSVEIEQGRITRIYSIANPAKLGRMDAESELTR